MSHVHYEDTYGQKNWVTRFVDLLSFCDRNWRRFGESMMGMYLLDLHRARKERKRVRNA